MLPSGTKALGSSVSVEAVSDAGFKVRLFHVQNTDCALEMQQLKIVGCLVF